MDLSIPKDKMPYAVGTVYIIDDDHFMSNMIKEALLTEGYHVFNFETSAAFFQAEIHQPGVLILDMMLHSDTGVQVQAKLVNLNIDIPIVFISGDSTAGQSVLAMKQGAIDFLIKPFELEDLLLSVEKAFETQIIKLNDHIIQKRRDQKLQKLTKRELQVYHLLLKSYNNTEIMETLKISMITTKQYKRQVMQKLEVITRSQLVNL